MQTAQNEREKMQVLLSIPFRTSSRTRKTACIISQILPLVFQVLKAIVRLHAMKVKVKKDFNRRLHQCCFLNSNFITLNTIRMKSLRILFKEDF